MIPKLKRISSLQIYTQGNDRQLARILLTIILAYWAVSLLMALIYASSRPTVSGFLLLGCLTQFLPLAFLFRGRLFATSVIIVGVLILAVTFFATLGEGIHDYTLIVFPAVIMLAGLAGNRRVRVITTLLILAAFAWLVLGEANGWFIIDKILAPNWADLVNISLLLLISALAAQLLTNNMESGLERARHELAERQRAEQSLAVSQTRLQMLTDATRQSFILLDRDGTILYLNRITMSGFQALFGQPIQEGQSIYRFISEADREDFAKNFHSALRGSSVDTERSFQGADGQKRVLSTIFNPVYAPDGSLTGVGLNNIDITDRKLAEQKFLESESQNRAILESVPDTLFRMNRQGIILDYRSNDPSMLLLPPEFFLNKRLDEVLPAKIAKDAMQAVEEVFSTGRISTFEYDLELKGEARYFENRIVPLHSDQVLSVVRDITDRRRTETALRESEALYHAMFDKISAVKLLIDPQDGSIVRANQAAAEFYGYPIEQLERMNINRINTLPEKHIYEQLQQTANRNSAHYAFQHRLASGEIRDVEVYTGPVELNGRQLLNSIIHDVTERNQAQAELVQAHAQLEKRVVERTAELHEVNLALEKALHARDQFLATVSHELRTPLIGILSLSQTLQFQLRPLLNEKQTLALKTIEQSGQRLHDLVNDVIDFSRLQSGDFSLQVAPFEIARICKQALQGVRETALQKHQELAFSINPENIRLEGDERRVKQIISNLLGNAVKFTPENGRISLAVNGLPAQKQVRVCVSDTGIGIQPENLERLFQPFTQLDSRLSRQYNGTGLGLALVQRLVELHGGRVEVQSVFGEGSTFCVYLPWEPDGA